MIEENRRMTPELIAEVRQWVHQLVAEPAKDWAHAASELGRLGVRSRGSIGPRGTLERAALSRWPESAPAIEVVQRLTDTVKTVRCQVALALGEWDGEDAARALGDLLQTETDEEVQMYCITALRTIGGLTATKALRCVLETGSEAVRGAAISAIQDLLTGGQVDDTESVPLSLTLHQSRGHMRGSVHAFGTVRPGNVQQETVEDVVDGVVDALQSIRDDEHKSPFLRVRANAVLDYFGS